MLDVPAIGYMRLKSAFLHWAPVFSVAMVCRLFCYLVAPDISLQCERVLISRAEFNACHRPL